MKKQRTLQKTLSFIFAALICLSTFAFSPNAKEAKAMSANEFLSTVGPMATADMQKTGILASMTLAQAILESGWGTSELAKNANALFGMKKGNWTGATYYYNGTDWRAYGSWQESVNDHGRHLSTMSRYSNLVGETDYKTSCYNVAADGYCSDVGYAESLIELIEKYNLTQFDAHASLTLDGHEKVDLGEKFYAFIRNTATGLYLTDKDYNVTASEQSYSEKQLWNFQRHPNGSYSISMDESGYYFDVSGANYQNGTNIQMAAGNNTLAQKFFIYYINGNFYFKTVAADLVIDMDSATGNIQLYGNSSFSHDTSTLEFKARSFEIIIPTLTDEFWDEQLGETLTAYIRNMKTGFMLTADAKNTSKVSFTEGTFSEAQKWILTKNKYGGYEIKSALTSLALDIDGGHVENGTSVGLWAPNESKAQTFYFIKKNEGMYIKAAYCSKVLDTDSNTGEVHIYPPVEETLQIDAQVFEIVTEKSYTNESPVNFGTDFYAYILNDDVNKAITDKDGLPSAEPNTLAENQLWHFEYDEKWNAYKITGSSGKVMDVSGAGWWSGAHIIMYDSNDSAAQRFRLYATGEKYYISPACTSKIFDVDTNTGTRLQIWGTVAGQESNTFTIVKVTKDGKKPVDLGKSFTSYIKNKHSSLFMTPIINSDGDVEIHGLENAYEWLFTRQENGSYLITDKKTGNVLDIRGGEISNGTPLQTFEPNDTYAQYFFIYEENGGYVIQPSKSNCVFDMDVESNRLQIWESNQHINSINAQTFEFSVGSSSDKGLVLKKTSQYRDLGKYISNVIHDTTVSEFLSNFDSKTLKVYDAKGNQVANNTRMCTGFIVKDTKGNTKTAVVSGDLDGSGIIDSTDLLRMKMSMLKTGFMDDLSTAAGDIDGSKTIDSTDYLRLKSILLKK